jgi:hypothetical protein
MPTSPSIREQILTAMVTALNAPEPKPAVTERDRVDAVTGPAIVLHAVEERVDISSRGIYVRRLKVRLEMYVSAPAPADSAIDPLYTFAVNTLMQSEALGEFLQELREAQMQWGAVAGEQDLAMAQLDFEAVYTTTADPTEIFRQ